MVNFFSSLPSLFLVHSSLSPFQGSMEAEENSPSASTPASPQTKTASEGELSTTATELLQDYMTTVCSFHPLIPCPFLLMRFRQFEVEAVVILVLFFQYHSVLFFFSCGPNCHHRRSSSLPPCFMNTVMVPPSMSSALTCDNFMGTAGSFFYLVRPLYFSMVGHGCTSIVSATFIFESCWDMLANTKHLLPILC